MLDVECLTVECLDGSWSEPSCGGENFVLLPAGAIRSIVHTHPGGTSLSLADLRLLSRVERVTAITRTARRGTNYSQLDVAYAEIRGRVVSQWALRKVGEVRDTRHTIHLRACLATHHRIRNGAPAAASAARSD